MENIVLNVFGDSIKLKQDFLTKANIRTMVSMAQTIADTFKKGNKLLLFGNGGSAADAQHLAAEFVNRLRRERRPLPALALTTDTSILTSVSNDYDFSDIFSKQVDALGMDGDVAWGFSTSGKSPNVIKGLEMAKRKGLITIALSGGDGGPLIDVADVGLTVNSKDTPRIQEVHITIGHTICEMVDSCLFGKP
jgi:D-sedoheptulose 7-phosphate isomerase